jgi:hypothetical protein
MAPVSQISTTVVSSSAPARGDGPAGDPAGVYEQHLAGEGTVERAAGHRV